MADNLEWARLEFPDFAASNSKYLEGIVHEAEHNVQPFFGLGIMVLVGVVLAVVDKLLAQYPILGATELPVWLVSLIFLAAYTLIEPVAVTWIRRSIRARVAEAQRDRAVD